MAWIVKNSASMEVNRREEPYLDDAMKKHLEDEQIPRFPTRQAATLPTLHAIQDKHGWIPYQAIEEAAAFLELSPAEVLDTATFYEEFHLHPKGKYLIQVCQSLTCEVRGQRQLLEAMKEKMGLDIGQTSTDGKFTLEDVECLGACDGAPCALVEGKLHEKLTIENIEKILNELD